MFRKKLDIEVINLFNKLENKIDTINSNFDCVTFLDACCKCKERDVKINDMLITYLECKFSDLSDNIDIDSILLSVKNELQNTLVSTVDHKSSFESLIDSITYLKNETINLKNEIQQLKEIPKSDKLLRNDLNTFLVAIKDDIKSDIKGYMQITLQNIIDNNTLLKNTLDILINKTDAIFFDNEIIKHQFSIEENIKIYSDTIDSLKLSIEKSINDIDIILIKFV